MCLQFNNRIETVDPLCIPIGSAAATTEIVLRVTLVDGAAAVAAKNAITASERIVWDRFGRCNNGNRA